MAGQDCVIQNSKKKNQNLIFRIVIQYNTTATSAVSPLHGSGRKAEALYVI